MDIEASTPKTSTFFLKEIVSSPTMLSNGKRLRWEPVAADEGILATTDAWLAGELREMVKNRVGGVLEIDQETYELKKNSAGQQPQKPRPWLTDMPQFPLLRTDSRDTPVPVAVDNVPSATPAFAALAEAKPPLDHSQQDPILNRPVVKRAPKIQGLPKSDLQTVLEQQAAKAPV